MTAAALTAEEWADWFADGDLTPILEQYGELSQGVAALALHRKAFGFTRDDVQLLREMALNDTNSAEEDARLEALADRIEALLPPVAP